MGRLVVDEPLPRSRRPFGVRSPRPTRTTGALAVAVLLVLGACGGSSSTTADPQPITIGSGPTGSTASSPASDADFAGRVDIGGGRAMSLECRGRGTPVVVLVSGLRGAADLWNRDTGDVPTVLADVAATTRVCAYDRPGTPSGAGQLSRSDEVTQPTTTQDAVGDLHALLGAAGLATPVVLAGHSYGGMVTRLYASTYPDDVAGMVLVDALSEFFRDGWAAEDWEEWKKMGALAADTIAEYPAVERLDFDVAMDQLVDAPPIRPMPLIVLSADVLYGPGWADTIASGQVPPDTPAGLGVLVDTAQRHSQAEQARLVPDAEHVTDTDSGHNMMIDQPQLVADAVLDVVDAVRRDGLTPP